MLSFHSFEGYLSIDQSSNPNCLQYAIQYVLDRTHNEDLFRLIDTYLLNII